MIELSIVVPIYNVENYLNECLESIYKLNIKKEVILVNDESPDNSYLIIEKFKKRYFEETIVINQKNKGLSGARNSGLKIARGKYISFIDSDDFIDFKKYEKVFFMEKEKDLDIILNTYTKIEDDKILNNKFINLKKDIFEITSGENFFKKSLEMGIFKEEVWDDFYKRDFLLKNNIKFKEKLLHEDVLFSIEALSKAKKVKYTNIPIYFYRQRSGSIMSNMSNKNFKHKLYIIQTLIEKQECKEIHMRDLNSYLLSILWGVFVSQKKTNKKILKKFFKKWREYKLKDCIKLILISVLTIKCDEINIENL